MSLPAISLPEEFKSFIKKYNGAVPISNQFFDSQDERMIERFLCLLDDDESDEEIGWYDIEAVLAEISTRLVDDGDLVGCNVIPFALLFGGDFVCLDLRDSEMAPVVVWYHEESEDFSPVFATVAKSMTEFLEMVKE